MNASTWPYWCLLALAVGALLPPVFWISLLVPLAAFGSWRSALLILLCLLRGWMGSQAPPPGPLTGVEGSRAQVVVRVCEAAVPTAKGCRFVAEVHHWTDRPWGFAGRWLVEWKGGSAGDVAMGDFWHLRGKLTWFPPPAYPGDWDGALLWGRRGVTQRLKTSQADFVRPAEPDGWYNTTLCWRARLTQRMADRLPAERSGLLSAVVYGDGGRVSPALNDAFRQAGVSHLLVASGANVAILVAWVCALGRLGGFSPQRCAGLCLWLTPAYVLLAGCSPAMVRAGAMSWVALLARFTGQTSSVGRSLALGSSAVLAYDPNYLFDLGFQLSFAAVAALAWLQPPVARWLGGRWPMLTATLACALGLIPLSWSAFGCLQPVAILSNLWMGPLCESLLPAGLAWSLVDCAWPQGGKWLAGWLDPWLWLIQQSVEFWARCSWQLELPAPTPVGWAAWGLLMAVVVCGPTRRCLVPMALAPLLCLWPRDVPPGLQIRCLQMGFAPCFWLRQGESDVLLACKAEQVEPARRMLLRSGGAGWARVLTLGAETPERWRWGGGWLQSAPERVSFHQPPFSVGLGSSEADLWELSWSVSEQGQVTVPGLEPFLLQPGQPWQGVVADGALRVSPWASEREVKIACKS